MSFENLLPAGWEAKFDSKLGKTYYINHNEKTTSWDPPYKNKRSAASTLNYSKQTNGTPKHITNMGELIPLQHGSPDLRRNYVYPTLPPPIPAFQVSPHQSPKINLLQDLNSKTRVSPLTVRPKVQDSSLTVLTDTDEAVSKISAMFPTVSEAHIRLLMKKFHNREVLVISALQVEKNPITTPGPFSTPPPQRNIHQTGIYAPLHMTSLGVQSYSRDASPVLRGGSGPSSTYTGSPRIGDGFRTSRPHSSPKLKLSCRYMKSIFPLAEETIILDVLYNNDNSIQKSSDKLRDMGFEKKDTSKIIQQKTQSPIPSNEDRLCASPKHVVSIPKIKTSKEKAKAKIDLQNEYVDIPERLIVIALESVDFDKDKASSLLKSYSQESSKVKEGKVFGESELDNTSVPENNEIMLPPSHSKQSLKSLLKSDKNDKEKALFNRVIEESSSGFRSSNLSNTRGANPELSKGNNEKLLLEDYVKWQGPNSSLRKGSQKVLAKGPNPANLLERHIRARGPNMDFHKGPNKSVVKGSIFQQMKAVATIGEESRGK